MSKIKKYTPAWLSPDLVPALFALQICAVLIGAVPFSRERWVPWNLFLAWLPLVFAVLALRISHSKKGIRRLFALPFWLLWLFFFPNAPYMLTDLIHLNRYPLVLGFQQFSADPSVWLAFLHIVSGAMVGCALGSLSLLMLQRYIEKQYGARWGWIMVAVISLLSGVAIWLGRVLRFNSWDIVTNPFGLLSGAIAQFDGNAFMLTIIFAVMTAGSYLLLRVFLPDKPL